MKLHVIFIFPVLMICISFENVTNVMDVRKIEFCSRLKCKRDLVKRVCGLRSEGGGFRLKLFENECELLMYGCSVDEMNAYGLINTEYCDRLFGNPGDYNTKNGLKNLVESDGNFNFSNEDQKLINRVGYKKIEEPRSRNASFVDTTNICSVFCDKNTKAVCGIRKDGVGYRIRLFDNECELVKHNCENTIGFIKTDTFICEANDFNHSIEDIRNNNTAIRNVESVFNDNELDRNKNMIGSLNIINSTGPKYEYDDNKTDGVNNLIVVNSKIFGQYDNINDSIDTFFAASHVLDLPLREVPLNTRRKMLQYAGPIKVFVPWIEKPSNISNDTFHRPTLSSCYHKCPYKCPDTYAPVCGVPGVVAREPSLMFQNHCFMDVAQCKMFWEHKSSTSQSSSYVESSFLFCMGDEMNAVYRFLPAIRTLQHMGRLKKKGKFRAILKNFRFVSEFRYGRPKFMGRK